ncbi:MerR family transcriptional regulator [Cellulomonas fimi]|uniref:Regulatory protein MerR n=1 Tax=Cellulomonas fimi (strain ATCC 484 / DSM 20113 / JCM 1341 / CCUG 24087 / LMG 16345 / NBRC 15513 / NCIMB 8980 / NCTC 7547 / NRS-133) TaxID=590998 RepID=F4H7K5_CELFA|nr:MerR family transcriptional regulator [Cellulomonas fimi]AEE44562.1 regulatory protein MerR [Cellulomonas fimi ATCC 484]NNH06462.1 MerR family transcriptional regulator [Cellulomonas fimi]VEH26629.1 Multidrug-efflux transporter 1 regulator [Cellulomonas fimi]
MHDDLLSIGELARAGGLPVTALRYYDATGVLRPAHVDPVTGYRWYTGAQVHPARLVASLRRAGLPVADLVAVLRAPEHAAVVLDRHRRRLVEDLVAAQAHLDDAAGLLAAPARCVVAADALVGAVGAVRHAVGAADARWPGLAGVLLHLDGATLRLVGCDRSRLAVASVPVAEPSGPPVRVLAPPAFLDALTAATLPASGPVTLHPHRLEVLGRTSAALAGAYPDYERLLPPSGLPAATMASGALTEAVVGAGDVVVVRLDGGRVALAPPRPGDTLGYSRSFLLDAVRAARAEHVALSLDDERAALGVSPADRPADVGLVMPVLLHR